MQLEFAAVGGQSELAVRILGMLITRSHLEIPREVRLTDRGVFAARVPRNLTTCYQGPEVYRGIADMLHLPREVADQAYARHASAFARAGYLRWR